MTTIVFHAGVIAWDSRGLCAGIIHDNTKKHYIKNGVHFWIAGCTSDIHTMMDNYINDEENECDSQLLIYDSGTLIAFGVDNDKAYKTPIEPTDTMVIGTGSEHAYTAIDCGCNAKEAVKMAMKRDPNTGGKIHTFKLRGA